MLDKQVLGRGAVYIYIQVFVSAVSAYIFWLTITQLTSSSVVGTLSALVSITEILTSFAVIGIPNSIQRFLGKTFSEGNIVNSKTYITASLFIVSIGIIASTVLILVGVTVFLPPSIDSNLQLILIFVVASKSIQLLLSSFVISTLRTASLAKINILSSSMKIILSIAMVLIGAGAIGLAISYLLVDGILSSILLTFVVLDLLKSLPKKELKSTIGFTYASKEIIIGGLSNWVPIMVTSIGYQLGTIVLFGYKGSGDAAAFYLSLSIVNGILFSSAAIFTIALPALSGMRDARKRLTWQTIRWSSLISIPLSMSLLFYSHDIMSLFGENYSKGELSLQILLLSILPTMVADGVSNLVFSYGNYKQFLSIHLILNLPRVLLYFILIPVLGIAGGAISFVIGSILALSVSIVINYKIKVFISWKQLALILITPLGISFILKEVNLHFVYAIPISILFSYILLFIFGTITRADIEDMLNILPKNLSSQILRIWRKMKL